MSSVTERLEYLRGEIRAERISMGELIELQGLAHYIDPGDVELLEPAGVFEYGPTLIYAQCDVARALGVSRSGIANYLQRYRNTPEPAYATPDGTRYWDFQGFTAWQAWKKETINQHKGTS